MAISIQDGFKLDVALPVDERFTFATLAAMNAYSASLLYEGLITYVVEDGKEYRYEKDPDNVGQYLWVEYEGGGTGGGILTVADQTAREAIDAEERYDGLYVYQVDTKTMWQLRGGITNDKWVLLDVGLVLNAAQVFSANGEITLQAVMTQRVLISGTDHYTATLPTPTIDGQRVWVCGQSDQYPITLNGIDFTNGKNRWFQNVGGTWIMEE